MTPQEYKDLGMRVPPETEVTESAILSFNTPEVRAVGVPGGGAFATASAMTLFYQALLHGGNSHASPCRATCWMLVACAPATSPICYSKSLLTGPRVDHQRR